MAPNLTGRNVRCLEDSTPHSPLRPPRPTSVNLYKEEERLATFEGWPHSFLTPEELAADGFYYTGRRDMVRCTFCGIEVHGWEPGDSAHGDHEKWSPMCDMVRGNPCGNVPRGGSESEGYDTCGPFAPPATPFSHIIRPFSGPERGDLPEYLLRDLEHLGVNRTTGPAHSKYVTEESRLRTFVNWPSTCPVKPADLAAAGFYSTGVEDQAVCFHCGGGLKDWTAGDEPWTEHARWFSKCSFVLMHKGRDFVAKANRDRPALLTVQNLDELLAEPSNGTEHEEPIDDPEEDESPAGSPSLVNERLMRIARRRSAANLYKEAERLATFEGWPHSFLTPEDLAREGFYYTGRKDNVRCAFCGIGVHGWVPGDSAHADHEKWSPQCDMVRGKPCGNVPKCEPRHARPFSGPGRECMPETLLRGLEQLGVSRTTGPTHREYVTEESRLRTFVNWPSTCPVKPADLAAAGFFYTGREDETICFHCAGGLKFWEAGDDPWTEHVRWFSKCSFVVMQKGRDFVAKASSIEQPVIMNAKALDQNAVESASTTKENPANDTPVTSTTANESSALVAASASTSNERTLRDMELCTICFSQERTIVFLPCGHFVSCSSCASALSNCPVCRKPCEATIRAYLS